ncbi:MAG: hypothetical protein R3Y63_04660 [Eubacteriales bacterium]
MKEIIELIDETVNTGHPIFLIDAEKGLPVAGNTIANDLFAEYTNKFDFFKIFTKEMGIQIFMILENFTGYKVLDDCFITTQKRETLPCSLEFIYGKDSKESILLIVKIKEDQRSHFLNIFLNHMKRPAFMMECVGTTEVDFLIRSANELFYTAFATSKETFGQEYDNHFQNIIHAQEKDDYMNNVIQTVQNSVSGIINVPVQTANGDNKVLYFSHKTAKPLLDKDDNRIFCLLVDPEDTLEEIECTFTNKSK